MWCVHIHIVLTLSWVKWRQNQLRGRCPVVDPRTLASLEVEAINVVSQRRISSDISHFCQFVLTFLQYQGCRLWGDIDDGAFARHNIPLAFSQGNKLAALDNGTSGKMGYYFVHHCNKRAHCSLGKQDCRVPNLLINSEISILPWKSSVD